METREKRRAKGARGVGGGGGGDTLLWPQAQAQALKGAKLASLRDQLN